MGDARAAGVRGHHDAQRRRPERTGQFLADGRRSGRWRSLPGLGEHDRDGHDDDLRRGHHRERPVEVAPRVDGRRAGRRKAQDAELSDDKKSDSAET